MPPTQGSQPPAGKPSLRRAPRQARGRERVDRVLDAAAALVGEVGYEAVTTNAIAERAGTSIGSLYQFFPNKQAILRALAARYLDALQPLCDELFAPEHAALPLDEAIARIVDRLSAFHAAQPGFQAVFYGSHGSPELAAAAQALTGTILERLESMLGARAPGLPADRRALVAAVVVETVKAMLALSVAAPGDEARRRAVIGEAKGLLWAYLEAVVGD